MPLSWKDNEQQCFFKVNLTSYVSSLEGGKLKDSFWPMITEKWFELWPLSEPSAELVKQQGLVEKAKKVLKMKNIEQLKRSFKAKSQENTSCQNLCLEEAAHRKKSEVQMYMILHYETRIRKTVVKCWAENCILSLESQVKVNIPEDEIEPHESYTFKDLKIPIAYKNAIATQLYEAESETFKTEVRKQKEAWRDGKTVHTDDENKRLELVCEYQKNIPALGRNMMGVLRNAERKCSAKGISWLACPSPANGGKPVGFFQCTGGTPKGEDFEGFLGLEKAEEFKTLFTLWIHTIYSPSDWHLYSFGQSTTSSTNDSPTTSGAEQENGEGVGSNGDAGSDKDGTGQRELATTVSPLSAGGPPLPTATSLTVLPEADTTDRRPSSGLQSDVLPASPPQAHIHAHGDQVTLALKIPNQPDLGNTSYATFNDLLMNARESGWMKFKKTLKYFHEVYKLGKLPDLILHWYQLEEALGFLEITPKRFPLQKWPKVLASFFKNGHNYKKGYGLKAGTIGIEIIGWWEQVKSTGVGFGRPTGMYTIVVLVSWWCSLLDGRPESELSNCLHTLDDIDQTILSAVQDMTDQFRATPTPSDSSTIAPSHGPRGSKRAVSDKPSSRKCARTVEV